MHSLVIVYAALAATLASPVLAAERFYMMTTETEVSGTRELERGAVTRAIARSLPVAAQAARADKRAAALANLCIGHAVRREYDRALSHCEQAVSLDDTDAALLVNRGVVRYFAGQREAGISDFERALTLEPRAFQARANLTKAREGVQLAENPR